MNYEFLNFLVGFAAIAAWFALVGVGELKKEVTELKEKLGIKEDAPPKPEAARQKKPDQYASYDEHMNYYLHH